MKKKYPISRRKALAALGASTGFLLNGCKSDKLPPTYGNLLRMGDALTYAAQRSLLPGQSLAPEYQPEQITSFPATGTINPGDASQRSFSKEWADHQASGFAHWSLPVTGSVSKPQSFSLPQIRAMQSRTQITRHLCEEGWSAIAQWTGLPLGILLQEAGIKPSARFVNFFSYDGFNDSIDLYDAFHPQTILAYGMNGQDLPIAHGAPLRLRIETQIGYKSVKYLQRIEVSDHFLDPGDTGWAWYVGI